jgi:hypothetical protein
VRMPPVQSRLYRKMLKGQSWEKNLDDFDMCVVHRKIHELYIHEKMVPTVKAVLMKLQ